MIANPFVRLFEDPVGSTLVFAYVMFLLSALLATLYLTSRNVLTLYLRWDREGWTTPPMSWAARCIAIPMILGIDSLLLGALIWMVTQA